MKIAMIAPPWISIPPTNYGGTESVIAFIVDELVAQGHDVTLFASGDSVTGANLVSFFPKSLISEGVPWQAGLKAYYHLHKSLKASRGFDVIHTHLSSTADMFLFPLMAEIGTPHVTTLHSNFPYDRVLDWSGDADEYFLEWMYPAPVVTVSHRARANLPYDLNVAGVVHLGVPMARFQFQHEEPEPYVAWLGRFAPPKGAHLAIDAARLAGVPIVLAGIVEHGIRESEDYFETEIKPRLDGEQVRYIGPADMTRKLELLGRASALLNPITWEEPGATVVLEAMAVGCPVIAYPRGVVPELVVHGETGFLADDVEQMAGFIGRIGEIDRRRTHRHVDENFSARVMTEKYLQIYTSLQTGRNW